VTLNEMLTAERPYHGHQACPPLPRRAPPRPYHGHQACPPLPRRAPPRPAAPRSAPPRILAMPRRAGERGRPARGAHGRRLAAQVEYVVQHVLQTNLRPKMASSAPAAARIISDAWTRDPRERPAAAALLAALREVRAQASTAAHVPSALLASVSALVARLSSGVAYDRLEALRRLRDMMDPAQVLAHPPHTHTRTHAPFHT
jgi:hypothetical protein